MRFLRISFLTAILFGSITTELVCQIGIYEKIGIGPIYPNYLLHLQSSNPVVFLKSAPNNSDGSIIRFAESNWQGAYIRYDGSLNRFDLGIHDNNDKLKSSDVPIISIKRNTGLIGIGTINPEHMLHLESSNPVVFLKSDPNNSDGSIIRFAESNWQGGYIRYDGSLNRFDLGIHDNNDKLSSSDVPIISIKRNNGNVGIGTTDPLAKLSVNGKIKAKEVEITVDGFPDNVFNDDYNLISLNELENYINKNHHLPGIPSKQEVLINGINIGIMQRDLLKKIEELTLYIISLKKETVELKKSNDDLRLTINSILHN